MYSFRILTILATFFCSSTAQTFSLGGCRDIQGVDYIDYEKIAGIWFEYSRSPRFWEDNARCINFKWELPVKGEQTIKRLQIVNIFITEYQESKDSILTITGAGKGGAPDGYDYTILEVDYDNYMVFYICKNFQIAHFEVKYILTRQRFPSSDIILKSQNVILRNELSLDNMKEVNQTFCPNFWDPSSSFWEALLTGKV